MPELKQLRVLAAIAEAGSFSAAAERLDYTQPAVSKIIASLEAELGTVLVDRETRPIRLTDAGGALARHAERVFAQLQTAEAEIEAIAQLDSGHLSVGVFSSAGASFFVDALRALRESHPAVELSIIEGMPSDLVRQLRAGDLDLALVFDFPDAGENRGEGLEAHELLSDPFDVVLPVSHRLAGRRQISYADLADEDWLLPDFGPESPSMRLIDRGCAAAGFEPRVIYRVNDCDMTLAMVEAGEGISALPRLMLPRDRRGFRIVPFVEQAPIRRISAIRLPARYLTPTTERFLELLRAAACDYDRGAASGAR